MSNICDESIPLYAENYCEINKNAAIGAMAVIKRKQTTITDYTDTAQWEAAIANGDARIVNGIKVDIPDGSPRPVDNPRTCGSPTIQVGVDYTATITDANVNAENDEFWKGVNGKTFDVAFFYCDEDEIRLITKGNISARLPQSVGNADELQYYNVTISFRKSNSDFGELLDAPAGIFE